jgi:hypothetical protein
MKKVEGQWNLVQLYQNILIQHPGMSIILQVCLNYIARRGQSVAGEGNIPMAFTDISHAESVLYN